jgi:hypothetical protein
LYFTSCLPACLAAGTGTACMLLPRMHPENTKLRAVLHLLPACCWRDVSQAAGLRLPEVNSTDSLME